MSTATYHIGIKHSAFGVEGEKTFIGTESQAVTEAMRMAKKAGYGWRGIVKDSDGEWVRK